MGKDCGRKGQVSAGDIGKPLSFFVAQHTPLGRDGQFGQVTWRGGTGIFWMSLLLLDTISCIVQALSPHRSPTSVESQHTSGFAL